MRFAIFLIIITIFFLSATNTSAATYYVRTDGGNAQQCTGLVNAPYPGSGTNQPCAWSHPFWALRIEGGQPQWRLSPGDTLIIGSGSYMMGYGAPNTTWCSAAGAYDCVLPSLPNNVKILGEGWNSGCSNHPELWATERAWQIFDLSGSSGVTLACLEVTDHATCAYAHANSTVRCKYNQPPFGPWGYRGILIKDASNITLRDLNIHGFGSEGIQAGRVQNITLERVRIAGNGWSGWNGDLWGEPSSNQGNLIFRKVTIEWNGCVETYPSGQPNHCWAQSRGGYGDGLGTSATGGNWIFEDSVIRYNTSDGLDLLYAVVSSESFIKINRVKAYGNAGNQLKVGGPAVITNTLAISNCNYFTGKPFAQEMGGVASGDACRAGGAAISVNMKPNDQSAIINSTIVSEGWAQTEVYCGTHDFPDEAQPCTGSEVLYLANNIFLGFPNVTYPGDWPDLVGDGDPEGRTRPNSIDYNLIHKTQVSENGLSIGSHNIFLDPLFASQSDIDNLDAHLQAGSPAIDIGAPVGTTFGLGKVPGDDLEKILRPVGGGVDLGCYEFDQSLRLLQPNGGQKWKAGFKYAIKWQAPLDSYKFNLRFSTDNKATWTNIATVLASNRCTSDGTKYSCTYVWTIPAQDGRKPQSFVRVRAFDSSNQVIGTDDSDKAFVIEVLRLTSPNGGETLKVGSTHTITWETYALTKTLAKVILQYSTNGGQSWTNIKTFVGSNPGQFNWTVPNTPSTNCKVRVILKDSAGAEIARDASDKVFTIQQ
ncbi:MAG: right-handed parallel beta-helix repeat-containing protein [Candidatus Micrarchaeia archaeon]